MFSYLKIDLKIVMVNVPSVHLDSRMLVFIAFFCLLVNVIHDFDTLYRKGIDFI